MNENAGRNRRVLAIDDNVDIHQDYRNVLAQAQDRRELDAYLSDLFDDPSDPSSSKEHLPTSRPFELDSAFQGQQGVEMIRKAIDEQHPYALAFIDMRMPPGWDGLRTIREAWNLDPDLQFVICTAYSDYSLDELTDGLVPSDRLMVLKKPFDFIEVRQIACALTEKWNLSKTAKLKMNDLERMVKARTSALEEEIRERKRIEKNLRQSELRSRSIFEESPDGIVLLFDKRIIEVNAAMVKMMGKTSHVQLIGWTITDFAPAFQANNHDSNTEWNRFIEKAQQEGACHFEFQLQSQSGDLVLADVWMASFKLQGEVVIQATLRDITQRKKLEMELRQSQKMESVGQLAAGISHEINTPIQFVGDSAHFLQSSSQELTELLESYQTLVEKHQDKLPQEEIEELKDLEEELDLEFIKEEMPRSFTRMMDGLSRVSKIIQAMKEFAHPQGQKLERADLNHAIENALIVARNEYKYVADIKTDLPPLPLVRCNLGEINQILLNLLVNSAHAIKDVVQSTPTRGLITVSTQQKDDWVCFSIQDNGAGIPEEIQDRVFDQFFTTKPVGKGTGQGLALTWAIVERHQGRIELDSTPGIGTTFHIWLPVDGPETQDEEEPEVPEEERHIG